MQMFSFSKSNPPLQPPVCIWHIYDYTFPTGDNISFYNQLFLQFLLLFIPPVFTTYFIQPCDFDSTITKGHLFENRFHHPDVLALWNEPRV